MINQFLLTLINYQYLIINDQLLIFKGALQKLICAELWLKSLLWVDLQWNSWIFLNLEEEKGKTAGIKVKDEKVWIAYEDVATAKGKGIANQDKGQAT